MDLIRFIRIYFLVDNLRSPSISDCDSLSSFVPSPAVTFQASESSQENPTTLIELAPPETENQPLIVSKNEERQSIRLKYGLSFIFFCNFLIEFLVNPWILLIRLSQIFLVSLNKQVQQRKRFLIHYKPLMKY